MGRQTSVAVAREEDSGAAAEHAFIGGHPLDAEAMRDGQHFLGNAAFGRPNSLRPHSEDLLMEVERTLQLLARIFRMAKTILWQGQAWRRHRTHVSIAVQGKDRMVKRSRGNFD